MRLHIVSAVILAACSFVSGAEAQENNLILSFGGKRLSIPQAYFDKGENYNFTPDVEDPDSIFLRIYFPDFGTSPVRPRPDGGHGDNLRIQLSPRPTSLNIRYASIAPARSDGPLQERHNLKLFTTEPGRNGADLGGKPKEIYFSHQDGAITNLIICTPGYPSPPCKQFISTDDFQFELTYHMRSLSDWQTIEQRVRAIVEGFVLK